MDRIMSLGGRLRDSTSYLALGLVSSFLLGCVLFRGPCEPLRARYPE